jgi:dolichyl-phosphate beta-glucosyltransferase
MWLAIAVIGAIFLARGRGRGALLRFALVISAVVLLLPSEPSPPYHATLAVPTFFSDGTYRDYLSPGEIILPIPRQLGDELAWQSAADMNFRMTRGYLGPDAPSGPGGLGVTLSNPKSPMPDIARVAATIQADDVGAVVVATPVDPGLDGLLITVTGSSAVLTGGVAVYRVSTSSGLTPIP